VALAACTSSASIGQQLPTPAPSSVPPGATPTTVTFVRGTPPPARQNGALVFDGDRDVMVLFGGWGGSPAAEMGDTWTWDCQKWTKVTPGASPPARQLAAVDYDSDSHTVLLFGGEKGPDSALADTWSWNGSTWAELHVATVPPARMGAAFAFSPTLHRAVLFGGFDGTSYLGDTWTWDGSSWSKVESASGPAARANAGFGFDGDRLILFGGNSGSTSYADTWAFDGEWSQLQPQMAPSKRAQAALAEDVTDNSLVLFGGGTTDTWTWRSGTWTESKLAAPPPRSGFMLGFYPLARETVLFGGASGTNFLNDTWLFNGQEWTAL
jgi:hypothetical protein